MSFKSSNFCETYSSHYLKSVKSKNKECAETQGRRRKSLQHRPSDRLNYLYTQCWIVNTIGSQTKTKGVYLLKDV